MELNDLNTRLAGVGDPRPWIALTHIQRCTNCGFERKSAPEAMREERKGHYVRADRNPPAGTILRNVEALAHFAWCEKCSGERPLKDSLLDAIESAQNDRDLAQRAGHILADFFKRRKMGGEG